MTSQSLDIIRKWHRLQEHRGSCLAACRAIIDARSGGEGKEVPEYPALAAETMDPSQSTSIDAIVDRVRLRASAIVTVAPRHWMELARQRKLRSPYGDLGKDLHAVVIVSYDSANKLLVALDPYFYDKHQPVSVSRDDFAPAWSGQVEFVDP